jgi:tryptophan-rich sensory protein
MRTPARRFLEPMLTAAAVAFVVAGLGGAATTLGPWYYGLRMPPWKPPDWLFGPAWTLIYALAALAAASAWVGAAGNPALRRRVIVLFAVNSVLGVMWSLLFFRLQRPDWALIEVAFLWFSILALIVGLAPASRNASLLLCPYIAWVSFAACLNLAVVRLNPPFTGT